MHTRIETIKSLSAQLKRNGYEHRIDEMKKMMFSANGEQARVLEIKYRALSKKI